MMGPVQGKPVDPAAFAPFRPAKVLADVGGPRSFTFVPADGELYWAHWFDESADRVRYLVVPFSPALLDRLETGRISLREALDQPRLWVVDVDNRGEPVAATRTTLEDLPADELPVPGTMLSRDLSPHVPVAGVAGDGAARTGP
jgi:hypothetical protein